MLMLISLIFISIIMACVLGSLVFFVSNKVIQDRENSSPFECGFSTNNDSRLPFSLRFFLVALIFLIFDVELLILFPFLSSLMFSKSFTVLIMYLSFLFILSLGLFYEWNNFMLEWIKFFKKIHMNNF